MKKNLYSFSHLVIRLSLLALFFAAGYATRIWLEPVLSPPSPSGWNRMEWQDLGTPVKCSHLTPFTALMYVLPASFPGWQTQEPPYGSCFSHQNYAYTLARQAWTLNESVLNIKLMDCRTAPFLLENLKRAVEFNETDSVHFRKGLKSDTFSGFEAWYSDEKRGEIQLAVFQRFWLSIEGYNLESYETLHSALARVSFDRLANLSRKYP